MAGEAIKPKEGVREGTDPDPMGIDDDAFRDSVLKSGKDVGGGVEKSWEDQGREQEESEEESEEDEGGRRARAKRRKERRRMGDTALREMYTWEACERVVKKERADFVEFVVRCFHIPIYLAHLHLPSSMSSPKPSFTCSVSRRALPSVQRRSMYTNCPPFLLSTPPL